MFGLILLVLTKWRQYTLADAVFMACVLTMASTRSYASTTATTKLYVLVPTKAILYIPYQLVIAASTHFKLHKAVKRLHPLVTTTAATYAAVLVTARPCTSLTATTLLRVLSRASARPHMPYTLTIVTTT